MLVFLLIVILVEQLLNFYKKNFIPINIFDKETIDNEEYGLELISFVKPMKIYCCSCYFESLFFAKFSGKTCHNKILEFLNVSQEDHLFSKLLNRKRGCVMICQRHIAFQLIFFDNVECSHKDDYLIVVVKHMKKIACSYCFKKHYKKNYTNLPRVYFFFRKQCQKKYVCNCFFDQCLLSLNLKEENKLFHNKSVSVKDFNFWNYHYHDSNLTYIVCFDCALLFLGNS